MWKGKRVLNEKSSYIDGTCLYFHCFVKDFVKYTSYAIIIQIILQVSVCGGVNEYTRLSAILIGMIGCFVYLVLQWLVPLVQGIMKTA